MSQDPEHLPFQGKSAPMTVVTPITPWKCFLIRPLLWLFQRSDLEEVKRLRFIHFARWAIVEPADFARSSPDHPNDLVRRHYFLFSTNFNGPWDQYIDSFSLVEVVRRGMNRLWWSSDAFPKAFPIRRFKRYIRYHELPVDAYYNAYPDASIRDIEAALELESLVAELMHTVDKTGEPPQVPLSVTPFSLAPTPTTPDLEVLSTAVQRFAERAAHLTASTRRERTPALRDAAGPRDLQL